MSKLLRGNLQLVVMRILKKKNNKRKELMRKMKVMRKHKLLNQSSPDCSNGNQEELEMLKSNNTSLAKALSDQKIETNNWYTQVIALKGELLELQEKQAREPVIMNVDNVFGEIEKQVKEYYESIEIDFNSALDRLVKAVEKLTKVKQLVLGSRTTLQNCAHEIPSIFPRTSGSRVTLSSSGANSSLRQRAVPPMVGGHVLQPVMVPLAKLKIDWNDRKRNHILVDEGHNMSTIGERSSPENNEVSEEQQSLDAEDDPPQHDPDGSTPEFDRRLSEDQPRRYNLRDKTLSPPEQTPSPLEAKVSKRGRPSKRSRGRGSRRGQGFTSRISKSCASESPQQSTEGMEEQTSILDDPLEGPSWLLDVGKSHFYSRCRRRKTQRQKRGRPSRNVPLDSSDEESDGTVVSPMLDNGGFQRSRSRKKVPSLASTPTDSPPLSLDHSCLDSPRNEPLENAVGRRSKRHSKRKYSDKSENWEIVTLKQDKHIDQGAVPNTQSPVPEAGTPKRKIFATVDPIIENKKWQSCNTPSAFTSVSPVPLQEDADITCKIVTSMDMTMPVSDSVIHEDPRVSPENLPEIQERLAVIQDNSPVIEDNSPVIQDNPPVTQDNPPVTQETPSVIQENLQTCVEKNIDGLQDELKVTQSKRKFFKSKEKELPEEIQVQCERTPFDFSMLDKTVVDIPPYSSTRTTEKENLPPLSAKTQNEYASLCNVSVVLEDVMKQPQYSKTPKELSQSLWKESRSAKCISSHTPRKLRSVSRRTLKYTVNCEEDKEELEKPKRTRKTRRNNEFSSSLDNDSMKTSSTKTLDDEVLVIGVQESEDKKSNIQLKEQSSEKMEDPQGHDEEVEPTSDVSPDAQQDAETRINTDLIQKEECEENTQTGIEKDEHEDNCVVLEDCSDEQQIQEDQGTCQEQINSESPVTHGSPSIGFEGFQSSETFKISCQIKSFFNKSGKESQFLYNIGDQESSDNKSNAGISSDDCGRRRRAALKISSFKEVSLNRKMRRGDNNVVIVADSEKGRGRSESRGRRMKKQRRGKSTVADKAVEGETSS